MEFSKLHVKTKIPSDCAEKKAAEQISFVEQQLWERLMN